MKKRLAIASIVVFVLTGCSVNDFTPEVVIPKAIGSVVKTKNEIYLSSNKKFLEEALKRQDLTEEEYNKLKELLLAAKVVKDYSIAKKIVSFKPFRERLKLEDSVNKILSINYSNIKLYVLRRVNNRFGFSSIKEVPNNAILKKIDIDLIDNYNKCLNLTKKYKMYSLEKKLKKSYFRIEKNYEIGLKKVFDYLMMSDAYKEQSQEFILKVSTKLFNNHKNEEARTLLMSFTKYKLNEDLDFDIQPFYTLLVKYSYFKDANNLKEFKAKKLFEYAKNNLNKNIDFNIKPICNNLEKLGFKNYSSDLKQLKITLENKKHLLYEFQQVKKELEKGKIIKIANLVANLKKYNLLKEAKAIEDLYKRNKEIKVKKDIKVKTVALKSKFLSKKVFDKLVKEDTPNYCLTRGKYYYLELKNDFGDYSKVKFPASQAVLSFKEKLDKIEFNRDIYRAYLIAFIVKNSYIFANFFKSESDRDDEVFSLSVFLSSWLKYGGNYGYLPLTNITLENLQTKKAKFQKNVTTNQVANGLISYLVRAHNKEELNKRIMLLTAYLLVSTKGDITVNLDENNFLELNDNDSRGHSFLIFFMRTILKHTKNYKIQNLIYLLATKDTKIVKFMLKDKETSKLFNIINKDYNKNVKICVSKNLLNTLKKYNKKLYNKVTNNSNLYYIEK